MRKFIASLMVSIAIISLIIAVIPNFNTVNPNYTEPPNCFNVNNSQKLG